MQLLGALSPLLLLAGEMLSGPHRAPSLEGQYVIKDVVLVGAGMVIAATVRGGRLVAGPKGTPLGAQATSPRAAEAIRPAMPTPPRAAGGGHIRRIWRIDGLALLLDSNQRSRTRYLRCLRWHAWRR